MSELYYIVGMLSLIPHCAYTQRT